MIEYIEREIYDQAAKSEKLTKQEVYDIINKIGKMRIYYTRINPITLSPLNIEIAMNNLKEVQKLIDSGSDVNEVNEEGLTPLAEAVYLNNYQTAKMLLENGASVEGTKSFIPLIIAAENHNEKMLSLLLKYGANVNVTDEYGYNALHHLFSSDLIKNQKSRHLSFALDLGKKKDIKDLLKCIDLLSLYKIDINYTCMEKFYAEEETIAPVSALSLALEKYPDEVLKKLISLGASKKVVELTTNQYEYQNSFDFFNDIKDGDLSLWLDAPFEYLNYLNYVRKIKKFGLEVYTFRDDSYKRPKEVKKLVRK